MPSAFSHAVAAVALAPAFARRGTPVRLWVLGAACAMAPDLDVVAFGLGIPYAHPLGHRGLSHSLAVAALLAAAVTAVAATGLAAGGMRARAWLYLFGSSGFRVGGVRV